MHIPGWLRASIATQAVTAFVCALIVTSIMVAATIKLCRVYGLVSRPRSDRWHKSTPAFFGGVPIFIGFIALCALFLPAADHFLWKLVGIASMMFVLGLVDDIYHLPAGHKFFAQILGSTLLVSLGVIYPLRNTTIVNVVFSVVWLVGITNAFNLLDNMDGLAAGVALISAVYLSIFYVAAGSRDQAILVALSAGAIGGFLYFNFSPASIFMGDSGSLFIGFLLGATSLLEVTHVSGVPAFVLGPVVVLAIPIFDTLFVSVTRRIRGQPISQGGTDHSSHRLVRLGLKEDRAVLLLYLFSVSSGAIALFTRHSASAGARGMIGLWFLFILLFGVHLFRDQAPHSQRMRGVRGMLDSLLSRDMLVFVLDPLALALSYYLSYALRFAAEIPKSNQVLLLHSLPLVVITKIAALWVCKSFRHSWWRSSIGDVYRLGLASLLGDAACVIAFTGIYRFVGFSRAVFFFDAALGWILLLAIRRSFSVFRDSIYSWHTPPSSARRVFLLGTSELAGTALHFLQGRDIECVGLIDTNGGADLHRYVYGTAVVGRLDDLGKLASRYDICEVVLPESEELPLSLEELGSYCVKINVRLTKFGLFSGGG